jgi:hypothetical protein
MSDPNASPDGLAQVYEVTRPDGAKQLVLDDPAALAMFRVVEKTNCRHTFDLNQTRIAHFVGRIAERGLDPKDICIVILNVNDPHGGPIAEVLMPDTDWAPIRAQGMVPFARGLAPRELMREALDAFDKEAAEKLASLAGAVVVVVDHTVAEVYPATA